MPTLAAIQDLQAQIVTYLLTLSAFSTQAQRVIYEENGVLSKKHRDSVASTSLFTVVQTPDLRLGSVHEARRAHIVIRFEEKPLNNRKAGYVADAWTLAMAAHDAIALCPANDNRPWVPDGWEAVEFTDPSILIDESTEPGELVLGLRFSTQMLLGGGGY